jgi:hypothetical protein
MKRIAVISAVLLTACVHQVPIPDVSNDMAQLDAAAQSRCASSGYQRGTQNFNSCVSSVKAQFLQAVMVPVPPPPDIRPPAPPAQPLQTHCYSTAGVTNCSSY